MSDHSGFFQCVKALEQRVCFDVGGGFGVGSMIWVSLGSPYEIGVHLKGGCVVAVQDAEVTIDIIGAYWRILRAGEELCTADSDNAIGGPIDEGLEAMKGKRLITATCDARSLALHLEFQDKISLDVASKTCAAGVDLYSMRFGLKLYVVQSPGVVRVTSVHH